MHNIISHDQRIGLQAIQINRTDYCQFLTVSQKNYSLTYYSEHAKKCSHDVINRFLNNAKYTPSLLREYNGLKKLDRKIGAEVSVMS